MNIAVLQYHLHVFHMHSTAFTRHAVSKYWAGSVSLYRRARKTNCSIVVFVFCKARGSVRSPRLDSLALAAGLATPAVLQL